jgi:molybdenum cofactor cytidylyltransferase
MFMSSGRVFAVVPAAGRSLRMGRPKLLLPLGGRTVLGRLLEALEHPAVAARVVVVRADDEALAAEAKSLNATLVRPPVAPPDMRTSVQHALDHIASAYQPSPRDAWMLVPGDHPVLDGGVIADLIGRWRETNASILIPTHAGRRGHPTLFRWPLAEQVASIPAGCGLNWLVQRHAGSVVEVAVTNPGVLTDLDTPADYEALCREGDGMNRSLDGRHRFPET